MARRRPPRPVGESDATIAHDPEDLDPVEAEPPRPEPGGRFGRHVEPVEIARGGMAAIYEALDPDLERHVAIKVVFEGAEETLEEKLRREARITGRLEHPNIVPVHEMGIASDGRPYFTMKRVRGRALDEVLSERRRRRRRAFTRARLIADFLKVLDAVAFAHSRGVIHRDLKPSNVMIGEFGEVLVMDWGLAKVVGREDPRGRAVVPDRGARKAGSPLVTMAGTILGTPSYMPPEQAAGDVARVDERSDVYALGAILYEILTGEPPHEGSDAWDTIERVLVGKVVPPRRRAPDEEIPRELEAAVLKALSKNPSERYATVGELKEDIEAFLEHRLLAAASYTPGQRAAKWIRRNRAIAVAAAAVVLALAAAVPVAQWRAESSRAEELARQEDRLEEEVEAIEARLEAGRRELARRTGPDAPALLEPNGERAEAAIQAWYQAHVEVLALLERQAELARLAPTERARARFDLPGIDQDRRELALAASRRAAGLGDVALARLWVEEATAAGLAAGDRAEALAEIESIGLARIESDLAAARAILARSRQVALLEEEFFEESVTALVRRKGPDLVRLLLAPEHLASEHDWERRLAIETLGRIGDTRTEGPSGLDPVEALASRLASIDLSSDLEEAILIARALGALGDARADDVLYRRRQEAGPASLFWKRTEYAYRRLPTAPAGEGEGGPSTARGWIRLGESRSGKQDPAGAIEAFDRAIALAPDDPTAWHLRGEARIAVRDYRGALDDLDRAVSLGRTNAAYWSSRGTARLRLGDLDGAQADYTQAIALQPDLPIGYNNRGIVRGQLGDLEGAIADYDRALALDPRNIQALNNRGRARLKAKDLQGAVDDFTRILEVHPRYAMAYSGRASARIQLGRPDDAIADFTQALEIEPQNAYCYSRRGMVRMTRGDHEGAYVDLDRAIALGHDDSSDHVNRATLRMLKGDVEGAIQDYRRSVGMEPRSWEGPHLLARALAVRARPEDAGEALDMLEEALRRGLPPGVRLTEDPALASLRSHPRFQRLGR